MRLHLRALSHMLSVWWLRGWNQEWIPLEIFGGKKWESYGRWKQLLSWEVQWRSEIPFPFVCHYKICQIMLYIVLTALKYP